MAGSARTVWMDGVAAPVLALGVIAGCGGGEGPGFVPVESGAPIEAPAGGADSGPYPVGGSVRDGGMADDEDASAHGSDRRDGDRDGGGGPGDDPDADDDDHAGEDPHDGDDDHAEDDPDGEDPHDGDDDDDAEDDPEGEDHHDDGEDDHDDEEEDDHGEDDGDGEGGGEHGDDDEGDCDGDHTGDGDDPHGDDDGEAEDDDASEGDDDGADDDSGTGDAEPPDADGDGADAVEDCNDEDPAVHPGAGESCDEVDGDCDGLVDEGCPGRDCPDVVPDECLSIWQAEARGWIQVDSADDGAMVRISNLAPYDVCLDAQAFYGSDASQPFIWDPAVASAPERLGPLEHLDTYYASWTTDNGHYEPYLGSPAWWCINQHIESEARATFLYAGELAPEKIQHFVNDSTDVDGDGVEDHVDWGGDYGVQAEYNIWDYQATHAALTLGKVAAASGGEVAVTLTSENIGQEDAVGTVIDVIPAGMTYVSGTVPPSRVTPNEDGTTTLVYTAEVPGTAGLPYFESWTVTYLVRHDDGADSPYLGLPVGWVVYDDTEDVEVSQSLPAAVYMHDVTGDGVVDCP